MRHEEWMHIALEEAGRALYEGEVPVGAVLVKDGQLVCACHNRREQTGDPTAHAEILCLQEGARRLGTRRLSDCTLYVTLEPCPMCAGAMVESYLGACCFGARDPQMGCCESVYALTQEKGFTHRLLCVGGMLEAECAGMLKVFFSTKRGRKEQAQ